MIKPLRQVLEFHTVFKAFIGQQPDVNIPQKIRDSRIRLIKEEVSELIEAIEQSRDIKHIAKELADVMYVVLGTVISFGLHRHFDQVFDEVHQSNLTKISKKHGFQTNKDGAKILKGKTYARPPFDFLSKKIKP